MFGMPTGDEGIIAVGIFAFIGLLVVLFFAFRHRIKRGTWN